MAGRERGVKEYNPARLFIGSCLTLVVCGLVFAIRGDIIGDLGAQFHFTNEQLGWIAGAAFWGFVLSILVAGQLCDLLGMGRLLALACLAHSTGVLLTIFAVGFWSLWFATLSMGIGNALVEAAINPLIATIYPTQKTHKLNVLHAWFPWGIVLGGLIAFALTRLHMNWQVKTAVILIPTLGYGLIYFGQKFPTELGPNQWIPNILTKTASFPGILVLAWINGLMAIGRMLAGPVVHRLSPVSILIAASGFSAIGLFALSITTSAIGALAASTVFAIGVCYFWPTMLGVTSERFPAGGALLMAIMGGAGNLSVAFILPAMGKIYDLRGPELALRYVAILPVVLMVVFTIIWSLDRAKGGYRVVELAAGKRSNN
jgi:MFS family permease